MTGDFNIDLHQPTEKITELFLQYNLNQLIDVPTHNLGGILDLFFTNHVKTCTFSYPVYFTDHHFIVGHLHD